ncbi:MAG: hypothetical protein QM775_09080 [Pirellulales bacterium]
MSSSAEIGPTTQVRRLNGPWVTAGQAYAILAPAGAAQPPQAATPQPARPPSNPPSTKPAASAQAPVRLGPAPRAAASVTPPPAPSARPQSSKFVTVAVLLVSIGIGGAAAVYVADLVLPHLRSDEEPGLESEIAAAPNSELESPPSRSQPAPAPSFAPRPTARQTLPAGAPPVELSNPFAIPSLPTSAPAPPSADQTLQSAPTATHSHLSRGDLRLEPRAVGSSSADVLDGRSRSRGLDDANARHRHPS